MAPPGEDDDTHDERRVPQERASVVRYWPR